MRICFVITIINQDEIARARPFSHRGEGLGEITQGIRVARMTRGMARNEGLANWSNKLKTIACAVAGTAMFWWFLCSAPLDTCGRAYREE